MTSVLQEVLRPPKLGLQKPQVSPPQASSICGKRVWLWRRLCFYERCGWYVWALNFMTYQAIGTLALPKHTRPKPGMFDFRALRKIHPGPDRLQAQPLSFQVQGANLYGVELEIGLDFSVSAPKSLKRWIHWFNPLQRLELKKSLYRAFSIRGWCRCSITKTFFTRALKTCLPHSGHSRGHRPNVHLWIANVFFTLHASG